MCTVISQCQLLIFLFNKKKKNNLTNKTPCEIIMLFHRGFKISNLLINYEVNFILSTIIVALDWFIKSWYSSISL